MANKIPVITIDGPGGAGKGVVCQHLAERYGFHILDSGALYRLAGLAARAAGLALDQSAQEPQRLAGLAAAMQVAFTPTGDPEDPLAVSLEGEDVTARLRTDEAGVDASLIAAIPAVRQALFQLQLSWRRLPGLIADGRDMGTVVFPDASAKVFLTASSQARAERRYKQLKHKGMSVTLASLLKSIEARDERDSNRTVAPMRPAEDALVVDSTHLGIAEVLARIDAFVEGKIS